LKTFILFRQTDNLLTEDCPVLMSIPVLMLIFFINKGTTVL
jgi:hypothetical protein